MSIDILPAAQKFPLLTALSIAFRILAGLNALMGIGFGGVAAFADSGLFQGVFAASVLLLAGMFAAAICLLFAEMIRLALSVEEHVRASATSHGYETDEGFASN